MIALFFDVDGTLIQINGSGRLVMKLALQELFGTSGLIDQHNFAGATDRAIVLDLMTAEGFDQAEIDRRMDQLFDVMEQQGREIFYETGLTSCPGVPDLLNILSKNEQIMMGLLTGNSEKTASLKLDAAGISTGIFQFGAYGSDAVGRNHIADIAWQRAEAAAPLALSKDRAFVIGDTPADIVCGRHLGVGAIAVATGTINRSDLNSHEPDLLVDDLTDNKNILRFIFGDVGGS